MFYYDYTYFMVLIPTLIVSVYAQAKIRSAYSKYSKVPSSSGMRGLDAARRILDANGLSYVGIEQASGYLGDHYDPKTRSVRLSNEVMNSASVSSVAIASHECGHALQHAQGYAFLKFRTALFPFASVGSSLAWIIILIGFFMEMSGLVTVGIILFSVAVLFQIITLPVEFNASNRALAQMEQLGITSDSDAEGAKKVLSAAAMTYVAAAFASVLQLLRLIFLSRRRQ